MAISSDKHKRFLKTQQMTAWLKNYVRENRVYRLSKDLKFDYKGATVTIDHGTLLRLDCPTVDENNVVSCNVTSVLREDYLCQADDSKSSCSYSLTGIKFDAFEQLFVYDKAMTKTINQENYTEYAAATCICAMFMMLPLIGFASLFNMLDTAILCKVVFGFSVACFIPSLVINRMSHSQNLMELTAKETAITEGKEPAAL